MSAECQQDGARQIRQAWRALERHTTSRSNRSGRGEEDEGRRADAQESSREAPGRPDACATLA